MQARWHFRHATRLLLLTVVSLALASYADGASEDGGQPELTLDLTHHDLMGSTFAIRSATYQLDGKELLELKGTELHDRLSSNPRLLRAPLPAGLHVISMRLVYVGRSGVFMYVDRYRFTMQGYLLVESRPGYGVTVISTAEEQNPLMVQWQNRPMFKLGGLPQKAVLKVKVSPIERRQSQGDDPEQDLQPLAIMISAEDAKLLESRMRESAPETPPPQSSAAQVQVAAPGCDPVEVLFALGQSTLDRKGRRALERLSACLLRAPEKRIRVEGHCDERGSHALNDQLGRARAEATVKFLILRGVMPNRLEAVSFGKRRPLCSERAESCYTRNRRADFVDLEGATDSSSDPPATPTANRF